MASMIFAIFADKKGQRSTSHNGPSSRKTRSDSEIHFGARGADLRQTFGRLDKDDSGALTEEEFKGCPGGIGLDAQLSAILFNLFDKNKDGQVSLQEFLGAISLMVHGSLEERLSFSFGIYDIDSTNVIKPDEVRRMLVAMHRAQMSMCPATTVPLTCRGAHTGVLPDVGH